MVSLLRRFSTDTTRSDSGEEPEVPIHRPPWVASTCGGQDGRRAYTSRGAKRRPSRSVCVCSFFHPFLARHVLRKRLRRHASLFGHLPRVMRSQPMGSPQHTGSPEPIASPELVTAAERVPGAPKPRGRVVVLWDSCRSLELCDEEDEKAVLGIWKFWATAPLQAGRHEHRVHGWWGLGAWGVLMPGAPTLGFEKMRIRVAQLRFGDSVLRRRPTQRASTPMTATIAR